MDCNGGWMFTLLVFLGFSTHGALEGTCVA